MFVSPQLSVSSEMVHYPWKSKMMSIISEIARLNISMLRPHQSREAIAHHLLTNPQHLHDEGCSPGNITITNMHSLAFSLCCFEKLS